MPVYGAVAKNARMDALRAAAVNGKLQIATDNTYATILAEWVLDATAGSVTNDVWTLSFVAQSVDVLANGTTTHARIIDSSNADLITDFTVGVSAADFIFDSVVLTTGNTIAINPSDITHG